MTKVLNTRSNIFRFDHPNFNCIDSGLKNTPHYLLKVSVKDLEYEDGKKYFDITYECNFIPCEKLSEKVNNDFKKGSYPFNELKQFETYKGEFDNYEGEIIYNNLLTSQMVNFLLMDYEELEKVSGLSTVQRYKINIILSIRNFWD